MPINVTDLLDVVFHPLKVPRPLVDAVLNACHSRSEFELEATSRAFTDYLVANATIEMVDGWRLSTRQRTQEIERAYEMALEHIRRSMKECGCGNAGCAANMAKILVLDAEQYVMARRDEELAFLRLTGVLICQIREKVLSATTVPHGVGFNGSTYVN